MKTLTKQGFRAIKMTHRGCVGIASRIGNNPPGGFPPNATHAWEISQVHSRLFCRSERGGRINRAGYIGVLVMPEDPMFVMADQTGYCMEHRLFMARSIGRPLAIYETVHHINGDRHDNRLSNLQLRTGKHGKGVVMVCADCGSHNLTPVRLATCD